jgi:hypothetical protein
MSQEPTVEDIANMLLLLDTTLRNAKQRKAELELELEKVNATIKLIESSGGKSDRQLEGDRTDIQIAEEVAMWVLEDRPRRRLAKPDEIAAIVRCSPDRIREIWRADMIYNAILRIEAKRKDAQ